MANDKTVPMVCYECEHRTKCDRTFNDMMKFHCGYLMIPNRAENLTQDVVAPVARATRVVYSAGEPCVVYEDELQKMLYKAFNVFAPGV